MKIEIEKVSCVDYKGRENHVLLMHAEPSMQLYIGARKSKRKHIWGKRDSYKDHCKIYQKRPIYWLFDSGKKNGFKALIYMHRYQPDTIARIRTDYVHEQQARYRTAIADLEQRIANASTGERVKLNKKLNNL